MGLGLDYLAYVRGELRTVITEELTKIEKAAGLAVEALASGRTCWHADIGHMPEYEVKVGREARPSIFKPLRPTPHDRNVWLTEVRRGDLVVLGDQFDVAEALIDWALEAKRRGATVVGIGASMKEHRNEIPTRHASGKSLADVVDVFINTHAPMGDGALTEGLKTGFGATTGILNSAIYWALCGEIAERLAKKGVKPPQIG
ncbi:MAG: hypothetical protein QW057_00705 [Candidatus Bathyarchaeia archaeon]